MIKWGFTHYFTWEAIDEYEEERKIIWDHINAELRALST